MSTPNWPRGAKKRTSSAKSRHRFWTGRFNRGRLIRHAKVRWALTVTGIPISHVRTVAELDRRDTLGLDGVVEPLDDTDQQTDRPRAAVSS